VKMLAYESADELKRVPTTDIYVDTDRRRELFTHLLDSGYVKDFEMRAKRGDGNKIWVSTSIQIKYDDEGNIQYLNGSGIDITDRKQSDDVARRREKYLIGLGEAAQELLILSEGVPFQEFIDLLGPASETSRAYIFLNHTEPDGSQLTSQVAEWCADGISSEIDNPLMQNITIDRWPKRWLDILMQGKMLKGDVSEFPFEEREILDPQGIRTILMSPIIIDGKFTGFIGLDICTADRVHDNMDETFLRSASNDLAQAIRRSESERYVHA